ncbi:MAG: VWA domain-containing protein [Pseudomonadota bacterium]
MMVNRKIGQCLTVVLSIGVPVQSTSAADASSAPPERAVLVLDASGSMWGQIEGTHKITIARDVISGLLENWDPNVHLGVTAYGHREKGNCADIETLAPLGKVNRSSIMASIETLNPKGKTPLTDAVRQAAKQLRHTEERATVILVSDGKETCDADPCAAAAELEASGVDFTVHVVGFDLDAEEKAQLQCIADGTGGQFLNAANASELHDAMTTTVELVAEPAPKRIVEVKAAPLGTLLVENVTEGYARVYELGKTSSSSIASFGAKPEEPEQLRAGTYVINNGLQDLTEIDVIAGEETVVDITDFSGWLSVENVTEGYARVYELGKTSSSSIASFGAKPEEPEQLRAGTYVINNGLQDLTEIDVIAGEETVVDITDFSGWLSVENVTEGYARVYELGETSSSSIASFGEKAKEPEQLRAGTYVISNGLQDLTEIDVIAGEETVVDITDFSGWLSVHNVPDGYVRVYESGKTSSSSVASFGEKAKEPVQLRAGSYKLGVGKRELATFEIKPGEEVIIDLGG